VSATQDATTPSIPIESLADWHGESVIDQTGEKLGSLDAIYYDVVRDEPTFIAVKSGTLSKKATLVSLSGAAAGRDYIRVKLVKSEFKGLPSHDPDAELSAEDEEDVYTFFGLEYTAPAPGARRLARR